MAAYDAAFFIDISEDDDLSQAVDFTGYQLVGLDIPSNFDGTTITFTHCDTSGGTFLPIYDVDGNQYTITTAASRRVQIAPTDFVGVRFLKLVTGSAQTATDTIIKYAVTRVV